MLAGLATNMVFGFMRCAVLLTVFAGNARVAGYDPARTVTFVWIGQGLIAVVLIWGSTEFGERVRSGDIGVDLLRPVDLQAAVATQVPVRDHQVVEPSIEDVVRTLYTS